MGFESELFGILSDVMIRGSFSCSLPGGIKIVCSADDLSTPLFWICVSMMKQLHYQLESHAKDHLIQHMLNGGPPNVQLEKVIMMGNTPSDGLCIRDILPKYNQG